MTGYDPSQKVGHGTPIPFPAPGAAKPSAQKAESGGFFHHLWDTINPFQHLPVVSTVYRAVTGEHIGTMERIAGDTLYGGLWGAVSSVADTLFTAVTGKDFGDTVLALFTGPDKKTDPSPKAADGAQPAQPATVPDPNATALSNAMQSKGVDSDLARRAMYAYRRSMALPAAALAN